MSIDNYISIVISLFIIKIFQFFGLYILLVVASPEFALPEQDRLVLLKKVHVGGKHSLYLFLQGLYVSCAGDIDWPGWCVSGHTCQFFFVVFVIVYLEKFFIWNWIQIEGLQMDLNTCLSIIVFNTESLDFVELAIFIRP